MPSRACYVRLRRKACVLSGTATGGALMARSALLRLCDRNNIMEGKK